MAEKSRQPADMSSGASPLELAHAAISEAARSTSAKQVEREYFNLFIVLWRGQLFHHGFYYLTGFLNERPLARLLARAMGQAEPEHHAAILWEAMAGVMSQRFPASPDADRQPFELHLSPWIGRFFGDLECADAADVYRRIGALGWTFVDIETEAFALPS
jgi:TorA maturation chaperone TorD